MRLSYAVVGFVPFVLLVSSQYALAQFGDCPSLPNATPGELERLMRITFEGGDSPDTTLVIVVHNFNYVCLVSGMFRGTYRKLSVVVSYNCSGNVCPTPSPLLSQFDYSCNTDEQWTVEIVGTSEFSRHTVADGSLTTPNRTSCSLCIAPDHPQIVNVPFAYDQPTHCVGMSVHGVFW